MDLYITKIEVTDIKADDCVYYDVTFNDGSVIKTGDDLYTSTAGLNDPRYMEQVHKEGFAIVPLAVNDSTIKVTSTANEMFRSLTDTQHAKMNYPESAGAMLWWIMENKELPEGLYWPNSAKLLSQ